MLKRLKECMSRHCHNKESFLFNLVLYEVLYYEFHTMDVDVLPESTDVLDVKMLCLTN